MASPVIDPAEVYKQNCEDHRFYGDMRFKQLTLWSVGIGFLLNAVYGKDASCLSVLHRGLWCFAAFFWTAVIWGMEVRSTVHGVRRMKYRAGIEGEAEARLSNKWTLLNASFAIALLYGASCVLWSVQLLTTWGTRVITLWVMAAAFGLLTAFTVREYWEMLNHAIRKWQWEQRRVADTGHEHRNRARSGAPFIRAFCE